MGVFKERESGFVAETAVWILGQGCNLPGKGGRDLLILGYKITQKFYGFN